MNFQLLVTQRDLYLASLERKRATRRSSGQICYRSSFPSTILEWNNLPDHIRNVSSVKLSLSHQPWGPCVQSSIKELRNKELHLDCVDHFVYWGGGGEVIEESFAQINRRDVLPCTLLWPRTCFSILV